ncbi:family 7 extracellular solute-binding protein [Oceanimonas sp. GK1]|uniref:TRAP transporter substrate-binding protein DctP n=1 Tax=Oceanimonas sp. (strain GK1 / IBRC-M 10197) TaxID=511062 RepID=UPI0002494E78|nr:TRAP transporter substrate-binding protein DctP [Oceanimonas sp. GK1]AEY02586.1 family 7 extracellular solute-binding protein [Oceanimonas sp. GK1]
MNTLWSSARTKIAASLIAVAGMGATMEAMAADVTWRFTNLYSRGTAFGDVYQSFADKIEADSNGRMKINMLYAGEGVDTKGIISATKSGLLDMAAPFQPMHAGEIPFGVVEVGLPGSDGSLEELNQLFHEKGWSEVLTEAYDRHNLVWLDPYFQPGVYVITKKKIESIDDFKGLKIRAPGAYGRFFRELGASPVNLAWGETYTSLATGVIDGTIGSNLIDHRDGNFAEVAKFMYPLPVSSAQALPVLVNKNAWSKLPDDLKDVVRNAAKWHAQQQAEKSALWEKEAVADMEQLGMTWSPAASEADQAKWRDAAEAVWAHYGQTDKYSARLVELLK